MSRLVFLLVLLSLLIPAHAFAQKGPPETLPSHAPFEAPPGLQAAPGQSVRELVTPIITHLSDRSTKTCVSETVDAKGRVVARNYVLEMLALPQSTGPHWVRAKAGGELYWQADGNGFYLAAHDDGRTALADEQGNLLVWNPTAYVGDEQLEFSGPVLVPDWINPAYTGNVLQWEAVLTKNVFWVLVTRTVTITRSLRLVDGMVQEIWQLDGDPGGTFAVEQGVASEDGFSGGLAIPEAYDVNMNPLPLSIGDDMFGLHSSALAAASYPVTIDPTYTGYSATTDGYAYKLSSASWAAAHDAVTADGTSASATSMAVRGLYDGANYEVDRSFLSFDTSSIDSGQTITSATLRITPSSKGQYVTNYSDLCVVEGSQSIPFTTSDFGSHETATDVGGYATYSSLTVESPATITLNATGIGWVTKGGTTKLCLRLWGEIQDVSPGGSNYVWVYTSEAGTGYAPMLTVNYSEAVVAPTVDTTSASAVQATSAMLLGELTDDGGENCLCWFQYDTESSFTDPWETVSQVWRQTGQTFELQATGMPKATVIYYRAVAENSAGTSYDSSYNTLLTRPDPPTDLDASWNEDDQVTLTWTEASGGAGVEIRTYLRYFSSGSVYPSKTDGSDGSLEVSGTPTAAETIVHSLLAEGYYYYSAWSRANTTSLSQYSSTYDYDTGYAADYGPPDVTTYGATAVGSQVATLNATLDALNQNGGSVTLSFEWDTDSGAPYAQEDTASPSSLSAPGVFSVTLGAGDGLVNGTTYYYRAKGNGTNGVGYGSEGTFTPQAAGATGAPTMGNTTASNVSTTSMQLTAQITDDGGDTCDVEAWFVYGLSPYALTLSTTHGTSLCENSYIYGTISGLQPSTTYYFQARGSNSYGTSSSATGNQTTDDPESPTVRTDSASPVGSTSATLRGTITYDGGATEAWGRFLWGSSTGNYTNTTNWSQGLATGSQFSQALSGLTTGNTYYYIAQVTNDSGSTVGNGTEKSFSTVFAAPSDFIATAFGSSAVDLSWTKLGDTTYVYFRSDRFPVDRADGELMYSGTSSGARHSGLDPGTTYYYSAWSRKANGTWSDSVAQDAATTGPASADTEPSDYYNKYNEPPWDDDELWVNPSGNVSGVSNIPGYDVINLAADAYSIPQQAMWLAVIAAIALGIGGAALRMTGDLWIAGIAGSLVLFAGSQIGDGGIVPLWLPICSMLGSLVVGYVWRRA